MTGPVISYYDSQVVSKVDKYFAIFKMRDLDKAVLGTNNDCASRECKVTDLLMHVMAEEMYHRCEITEIPWQMKISASRKGRRLSVMKKANPIWPME